MASLNACKINAESVAARLASARKQLAAEEAKGELANPRTLFKYRDEVATQERRMSVAAAAWGRALVEAAMKK